MSEPLTGYEATSVADVESFLDDNPAASSDEVYLGTVGHSERAIAAVAAKRAGSGGGGSLPLTVVYDENVDQFLATGGFPTFQAPTGDETQVVLRDDNAAVQEDGSIILSAGIFLCAGMLDTITSWAGATGFLSIGIVGGTLNLFTNVPQFGSTYPAGAISAAIYAPPVLVAQSSPTACLLQVENNSNIDAHLSGWGFWAMRIADYPA